MSGASVRRGVVLVIDDDRDLLEVDRLALEAAGYEVHTATTGREGLALARSLRPDVIVLDIMMETLTEGFDVASALMDDPATRRIPVIMVSAYAQAVRVPDKFRVGQKRPGVGAGPLDGRLALATAYYEKPVSPARLVRIVDRILTR